MAQLSRRSKDNATDLVSLKEATNSRDEDIRKSLRDLVSNLSMSKVESETKHTSQAPSNYGQRPGGYFLENKPHVSPPGMSKSFSLPRIPSPNSTLAATIEREISASPYNMEGAASIALLEKILREMGTKEGQERVLSTLIELQDKPKSKDSDPAVVKKLEEILTCLKDGNTSKALVTRRDNGNGNGTQPPKVELDFNPPPRSMAKRNITPQLTTAIAHSPPKSADFVVNEDLQKLLKKMKDSITEGGGMTAEVKAHLRELRGEVLGMGREIARKLDQAESSDKANIGDAQGPSREEIAYIVQEGLKELRGHMETLIRERRRESSSSVASRRSVDSQEVYTAVKNALAEVPIQNQFALQKSRTGVERDDIIDAVREAWETCKPEIDIQTLGLERDEILECLKEGLQQYHPKDHGKELSGATYEEVLDAVREGLQQFKPPVIDTEASLTREEILESVRECLETFEFPMSNIGTVREVEITREDVLDAVKEGLSMQAPISKEIDFNREDLFEAVKAGLEGEKVVDRLDDFLDEMRREFKQYSEANGGDTEQVLNAMNDGLEALREKVEKYVDRAADVTGKDEIIDTVRNGLEHLREDLGESIASIPRSAEQGSNGELLDAMEKEFEHLRQTIATTMLRSGGSGPDREEILDVIRDGLGAVNTSVSRDLNLHAAGETLTVMRQEFEHLRETLATTLVNGGASADKEEMLDAIHELHESLRTQLDSKGGRPESILSGTGELLDAFNDGLEGLRVDIERMVNKPLDMTVNYEILDTLKEGLADVKADVDRLHTTQNGQRGFISARDGEVVVADENVAGLHRHDFGNLEMMITQLQIKVEALDNMPSPPPVHQRDDGFVSKEHFDSIETILRDIQASVEDMSQHGHNQHENIVTKDDTEAIETLLRNTKAQLDEMTSEGSGGPAKVVHIDSLESIMIETRDIIKDFGSDGASKKDIDVLEALLNEVRAGLEELRDKTVGEAAGDRVSKTDIEALETLCMDTKTQITELILPDVEILPTKEEIQALSDLIEVKNEMTGQAFDARKDEHNQIGGKIEETKVIIEDVRGELKMKIKENHHSIKDLATVLEAIGETVVAADVTTSVNELIENVKREFESLKQSNVTDREGSGRKHTILLERHDEYKTTIINELNSKIDERFDEIMTKYDDAQLAAQEKERAFGVKDTEQAESLKATKAAAEDLRLLVDTLGSTVTDSCDRMSEDSKTVFNRVEDVAIKLDGLADIDAKAEHQATRAQVSQTLTAVEAVQAHATEYHPKILEAVRDVLNIVGEHYEQTRASAGDILSSVNAIPSAIPLPAIAPAMPSPEIPREKPVQEKYDDSQVHAKLDQLVSHATEAGKSVAEVTLLEQIREQVAATATQVETLVTTQYAAITETNNTKAKEAEEAAIALEKRIAQKEIVEADVVKLSEQKEVLDSDVQELHREKEKLNALKFKMQADLSSLETALQIRREELHIMEARADSLERRILDGVLDHSRSLLTTSRPQSSLKEMNLKRVASSASNATATTRASTVVTTVPSTVHSAVSSGIGMALKRRQPPRNSGTSTASGKKDRRILSLSTLGANKGAAVERSMILANPSITGDTTKASGWGAGGLKRSHSVKSNFPVRKASWNGTRAVGMYADEGIDEGDDKENSVLAEEDEDIEGSEAGTERRTSYSGTYSGTGSYGEGSTISGDDKRTSYAASTIGTVGIPEDGDEESESESSHEGEDDEAAHDLYLGRDSYQDHGVVPAAKGETSNAGEMVVFGLPSDSGIGTDMPTAQFEGGSDYFKS